MENLPLPLKAELEKILLEIAKVGYRSNKRLAKIDANFTTDDLKYAFIEIQRIENLTMAFRLLSTQTCSTFNDIDTRAKDLLLLLKNEIPENWDEDLTDTKAEDFDAGTITRSSKLSDF